MGCIRLVLGLLEGNPYSQCCIKKIPPLYFIQMVGAHREWLGSCWRRQSLSYPDPMPFRVPTHSPHSLAQCWLHSCLHPLITKPFSDITERACGNATASLTCPDQCVLLFCTYICNGHIWWMHGQACAQSVFNLGEWNWHHIHECPHLAHFTPFQ